MRDGDSDPLVGEVSVSGELTECGVKASAQSRAVSAFDRLVGNVIDLVNPALEGIASRKRAKNASDAEIAKALTKKMVSQIKKADLPYTEELIESHYRRVLVKERNKKAVVEEAADELKKVPSEELGKADEKPQVSDDWLERFSAFAEQASSEAVRATWGKVLSGEIQRPGSFSFTTLRIISEIEPEQAQYFQELAAGAFRLGLNPNGPMAILKTPNLMGESADRLLHLESMGLLQEVGGFFSLQADGIQENKDVHVRVGPVLVVATPSQGQTRTNLNLPLIALHSGGGSACFYHKARRIGCCRSCRAGNQKAGMGRQDSSYHRRCCRGRESQQGRNRAVVRPSQKKKGGKRAAHEF